MLGLGRNYLTTIPDEIGRPKWLDLRNNLLTTIPDGIWRCTHYREIHLAGNPLTVIPKSTQNVHISL
jgi:Leucine-rich repeat (LRR) protein